jgi:hypothetical protein
LHNDYSDIRDRIDGEPMWFDERGVPRYCEFGPLETADIYADEALLMQIECQSCGQEFLVCLSSSKMGRYRQALLGAALDAKREGRTLTDEDVSVEWERNSLARSVAAGAVHYGDPPNADCCLAGASMNSVPQRVVEFWRRDEKLHDWVRVPELERDIPDIFADASSDEVSLPQQAPERVAEPLATAPAPPLEA